MSLDPPPFLEMPHTAYTLRIRAVSLIKGVDNGPEGLTLISDKIREGLCAAVPVSVLMGANVANEVARDELCESTVRVFVFSVR